MSLKNKTTTSMTASSIINDLKSLANEEKAAHLSGFFKTGKGDYAEGDLFYGINVPDTRKIAKKYAKTTSLNEIETLLHDPYHEVRLAALVMLILKYQKATPTEQEEIYTLYMRSVQKINNWDLVDISAPHIVGTFLYDKDRTPLWNLAKSEHLWSERIAVLSTFYFIKNNDYQMTLELAEHFLPHKHDLMHKATGWMLREVGKKDIDTLYAFLDKHYRQMPRTMLRYAIEKLPNERKAFYMAK